MVTNGSAWPAESADTRDALDELKIELALWPSEELELVSVEQNRTALKEKGVATSLSEPKLQTSGVNLDQNAAPWPSWSITVSNRAALNVEEVSVNDLFSKLIIRSC